MSTSSRKLTWLFDRNVQLRDDYLELKRTWKQDNGKREVLIWLLMKPIDGLIRLREKGSVYLESSK